MNVYEKFDFLLTDDILYVKTLENGYETKRFNDITFL